MHFVYLLLSEQTSSSYVGGPVTPDAGQTLLVYAPAFHGCHSLIMQACKYAALRQAWTVTLDCVTQRLLDHVRDSLSPDFWGIPEL